MMENQCPPGFERSPMYTGGEKGGLDPSREESRLLRRQLFLLYLSRQRFRDIYNIFTNTTN